MKTPHSELPWKVAGLKVINKWDQIIADCAWHGHEIDEPNVSFIVKACNNHEGLLTELKKLHNSLQHEYVKDEKSCPICQAIQSAEER